MNRAYRRSKQGKEAARLIDLKRRRMKTFPVDNVAGPDVPEQPERIRFHHGHSETHVVVMVQRGDNPQCEQFTFTPGDAKAFIAGMQTSLAMLTEHQRNQGGR